MQYDINNIGKCKECGTTIDLLEEAVECLGNFYCFDCYEEIIKEIQNEELG